jgi:hypothetical protein
MKKKTTRFSESAKLRHTKLIAGLCGFEYPVMPKNQYGGTFNLAQLEAIEAKIKEGVEAAKRLEEMKTFVDKDLGAIEKDLRQIDKDIKKGA